MGAFGPILVILLVVGVTLLISEFQKKSKAKAQGPQLLQVCPHCKANDNHPEATVCRHCGRKLKEGGGCLTAIGVFLIVVGLFAGWWLVAIGILILIFAVVSSK